LDSSFEENNSLSFEELAEKSKDKAWKLADFDNRMNIKEIAKAGKASQEILLYIESHLENQTIYFSTSKVNV